MDRPYCEVHGCDEWGFKYGMRMLCDHHAALLGLSAKGKSCDDRIAPKETPKVHATSYEDEYESSLFAIKTDEQIKREARQRVDLFLGGGKLTIEPAKDWRKAETTEKKKRIKQLQEQAELINPFNEDFSEFTTQ